MTNRVTYLCISPKRAEVKKHNAAVMCLARRRINVVYAMLTNREFCREPQAPTEVSAAA